MPSYFQENGYKIISLWYRTHINSNHMYTSSPKTRWRCIEELGFYLHILWECRLISMFWLQVYALYNSMCISAIQATPGIALLSIIPESISKQ